MSNWNGRALTEQTPGHTTVTRIETDAIPELLATRFALPGFGLRADGHLVPVAEGGVARVYSPRARSTGASSPS